MPVFFLDFISEKKHRKNIEKNSTDLRSCQHYKIPACYLYEHVLVAVLTIRQFISAADITSTPSVYATVTATLVPSLFAHGTR